MLVLTLELGERAFLGDEIVVAVVEIRAGRVRLGFDAPKELPIHRESVYRKVRVETGRSERDTTRRHTLSLSDRQAAVLDRCRAALPATAGATSGRLRVLDALVNALDDLASGRKEAITRQDIGDALARTA